MEPEMVVEFSEKGKEKTSFTWFKGGLFVAGPNSQIRVIKKFYLKK